MLKKECFDINQDKIIIFDMDFQDNNYRYTYRDPETYKCETYSSCLYNHGDYDFLSNLPNNITKLTIAKITIWGTILDCKSKYPQSPDDFFIHPYHIDVSKIFNNLPMSLELIEIYDIQYGDIKMLSDEELINKYFSHIPYGCKVIFCGRKYNNIYYKIQDILAREKHMRTYYYGKFKDFLDAPTQD